MRIPLDYYRILSVPIKATNQQLEQACKDRLVQQPRREYTQQAIDSRQELIERAYQVLSDARQRADYDAQFLVSMQPVATVEVTEDKESIEAIADDSTVVENPVADVPLANPTIEIEPSQFVGALLILHELGEYELVLSLGIEYYNSQEFARIQQKQSAKNNQAVQENIIL